MAKPAPVAPTQTDQRPKKRILLVDDDPVVVRALSVRMQASGYEVVTAEDGPEGLKAARQQKPDLILLDVNFPPDVVGWDGFRIMGWLQRLEDAKSIPVIIISGSDPATCKGPALARGAVDYLHKPVSPKDLLAAIRQALGENPPSVAPQVQ